MFVYSGMSSPSGFVITLTRGNQIVNFATSQYRSLENMKVLSRRVSVAILVISELVAVSVFVAVISIFPQNIIPIAVLAMFFGVSLLFSLRAIFPLVILFGNRASGANLAAWHGCEHKLIHFMMYFSPRHISALSIKTQDRVSPFCGSRYLNVLIALPILPTAILVALWNAVLGALLLGIYFFLKSNLHLLLQQFFITAEPGEEQIAEAVAVGKSMEEYFHSSLDTPQNAD